MAIYIGVNGQARKVIGGYVGVNGKAELIYNSSEVPSGYIPYKYLYSTSNNAYINTGLTPNLQTQIICNFKVRNVYSGLSGNVSSYRNGIFSIPENSYNTINVYMFHDNTVCINKTGDYKWTTSLSQGSEHSVNLTKTLSGDCYFDNTLLFTNANSGYSFGSIYLFRTSSDGSGWYSNVGISGFYAYNLYTKQELMNLIPCMRVSDNIAGMWDTIGKKFITAQNDNYTGSLRVETLAR